MQTKDIFIITRPDHSLSIYESLSRQDKLSFTFLTFKVVRPWMKKLFQDPRLVAVGKNAAISIRCTILNIFRYSFRFKFAQNWREDNVMESKTNAFFRKNNYRVVHYWPLYCYDAVEKWAAKHPEALVMADAHFPNPEVIIKTMSPIYKKYGIPDCQASLKHHIPIVRRTLENAPALMVPSEFVADTYREIFPDKKMYVVSYGITVSSNYKKRYRTKICNFVYAGGSITIEKGCDVLCDYFVKHPELNIHLYGVTVSDQNHIFAKYHNISNIIFHGHIAKEKLQSEISKYDVGIHLSRYDAYSLSVGEIIGCGLPVVVSNFTGIASEVRDYNWGKVTTLELEDIDSAIKGICVPENYNQYVDGIDTYIREKHKPFAEKMIEFYTTAIHQEKKQSNNE